MIMTNIYFGINTGANKSMKGYFLPSPRHENIFANQATEKSFYLSLYERIYRRLSITS